MIWVLITGLVTTGLLAMAHRPQPKSLARPSQGASVVSGATVGQLMEFVQKSKCRFCKRTAKRESDGACSHCGAPE